MKKGKSILIIGESCTVHTFETKGYDQFVNIRYSEPARMFIKIIEATGNKVTHIPAHMVPDVFPNTLELLKKYDAVLVSDIGANTFLLHPDTMRFGKRTPNLLKLIREYVKQGGGFAMIGGYMSFMGVEGKARYKGTPIEELLPVELMQYDDRVEVPEGADIKVDPSIHPILKDMPREWPYILGYNKLKEKTDAKVLINFESDPILTIGEYGEGRTVAWATDCSPHWMPEQFYKWAHYPKLWDRIIEYLCGEY